MSLSSDSESLVCVGGGIIGTQIASLCRARGWSVAVVDRDPECRAKAIADEVLHWPSGKNIFEVGRITLVLGDAIEVLVDIIGMGVPDHIVPGTSGHMLAKASVVLLERRGHTAMPDSRASVEVKDRLPEGIVLSHDVSNGLMVVSRMPSGGLCQDGCRQPDRCPVTGVVMATPLYEMIRSALRGYGREVVAVTTLLDGYGSLDGITIQEALETLGRVENGDLLAISTSCRCHGLINLLRVVEK